MNRAPHRAVLDTNVLLLWLVGRTDPRLLQQFKRVRMFIYEDIQTLEGLLEHCKELVTTPHIVSEASNFIDQASSWQKGKLIDEFKKFVQGVAEIYQPANVLIEKDEFDALGLTDTGIAQVSEKAVIITTDFRLAGKINSIGGIAINFNHYRSGL